jgi:hypothetical protein
VVNLGQVEVLQELDRAGGGLGAKREELVQEEVYGIRKEGD